jgi:hypothetical protein
MTPASGLLLIGPVTTPVIVSGPLPRLTAADDLPVDSPARGVVSHAAVPSSAQDRKTGMAAAYVCTFVCRLMPIPRDKTPTSADVMPMGDRAPTAVAVSAARAPPAGSRKGEGFVGRSSAIAFLTVDASRSKSSHAFLASPANCLAAPGGDERDRTMGERRRAALRHHAGTNEHMAQVTQTCPAHGAEHQRR